MSTVALQFAGNIAKYLEDEAIRRGYKTPSEFVQELIENDRERRFREELEQSLVAALAEPATDWTKQDELDIQREGRRLIERHKSRP